MQFARENISPGCSLEGMMLKLKLQYCGHLIQRVDSLEKILMLGGIGGRRKRGRQSMRWLDGITDSKDVSLSELWEMVIGEKMRCFFSPFCFTHFGRGGHSWSISKNKYLCFAVIYGHVIP